MERTVGVEEEFLIVDCFGEPIPAADAVVEHLHRIHRSDGLAQRVTRELKQEQAETNSAPVIDLRTLRNDLLDLRSNLARSAREVGARVAPIGISPVAVESHTTHLDRYESMSQQFGLVAKEQLSCGCHVHVAVETDEEGIAVLNRIRQWLPLLVALSANSPFSQGNETGYASYRSIIWGHWPTAGPTDPFQDAQAYNDTLRQLVETGVIMDEGMVYFDARLSAHLPTIEIRVADVCATADEAVLIAALCRALVETEARAWRAGKPVSPVRSEVIRAATWQSARAGLQDLLVHPVSLEPVAAAQAIRDLVANVAEALHDYGDYDRVQATLTALFERGTGADLQRKTYTRTADLKAVAAQASERLLAELGDIPVPIPRGVANPHSTKV